MSSTPALLDPADRARQRDEDAQYYREVLHKLIAMGTDLAEAVHRQALAEPAAPHSQPEQSQPEDQHAAASPSPSQATSFDRLARTVRRTIALARKLSEPAREAPGPKLRPAQCPHERRADRAETDALHAEPCERAEGADCDPDEDLDDDLDADFSDLDELIARLYDSPLAHLTDAELRQLPTTPSAPPSARGSAQAGGPSQRCDRCTYAAG
ncbi:MAG: hypothetical protein JO157_13545, partial [Acetobacteraceae bacterium]|nr:hypothetical protein [Acetobacteraceae bacterium]